MKVSTNTILLAAAAAVGVYLLTRPKTTLLPGQIAPGVYPPGYLPGQAGYLLPGQTAPGNTTSSIVAASGSAASSIINALGNLFSD